MPIFSTQQDYTGQTFYGSDAHTPLIYDSIRFLNGASGTFRNCTFNGVIQFGANNQGALTGRPIDGSGLRFENCTVTNTIIGAVDGAYFDIHGTVECHEQVGMAIGLTGCANIFADTCNILATGHNDMGSFSEFVPLIGHTRACVFKFGQMRMGVDVSSIGNVIRGVYGGAHEENLGWDSIYTARQTAVVTAVNGSQISVTHETGEAFSGTNRVRQHVYAGDGTHTGNYYMVTAQEYSGGTWKLSLDTISRFSTVPPIGTHLVLGPAMADCDWRTTEVHPNGADNFAFGYGCNVGFSLWGMCFGNDMRNVTVVCDGLGSLPASGIHDYSVLTTPYYDNPDTTNVRYSMNAHNIWDGAQVIDARTGTRSMPIVGLGAGTVHYSYGVEGITDPTLTPLGFLGGFGCSYNDLTLDGLTRFNDIRGATALRIDCDDISILRDGYIPQDYNHGELYWDNAIPSDWYPAMWTGYPQQDELGNDINQYGMVYNSPSVAEFIAQDFIDNSYGVTLYITPSGTRARGIVPCISSVIGSPSSSSRARGSVASTSMATGYGLSSDNLGFGLLLTIGTVSSVNRARGQVVCVSMCYGEARVPPSSPARGTVPCLSSCQGRASGVVPAFDSIFFGAGF
jgi:hypothetical protein